MCDRSEIWNFILFVSDEGSGHLEGSIIIYFDSLAKSRFVGLEDLLALVIGLVEVDDLVSLSFFEFLLFVLLVDTVAADKGDDEDKSEYDGEDDGEDSFVFSESIIIRLDNIDGLVSSLLSLELLFSYDFSS